MWVIGSVVLLVQELPEMWSNTKKSAIAMKQQVAPLQANEVANIRKRTAAFDVRQHEFREAFRKIEPLMYSCTTAYELIDEVQKQFTAVAHYLSLSLCPSNILMN